MYLPPQYAASYVKCLETYGLYKVSLAGSDNDDIQGGCSKEATLEHFSHRLGVSAGRIEYATIDPNANVVSISEAILSTLSEGQVSLLDIPSGPLVTSLSLLSTIAELRSHGAIPRLPLNVRLTGADCSDEALLVGKKMADDLQPFLKLQGIHLSYQLCLSDATDAESTAKLIEDWFSHSSLAEEFIVCISNFNGALIKAKLLYSFTPNLDHILARLYNKKSTLLWIEPDMVDAKEKLLPRIWDYLRQRLPRFLDTQGRKSLSVPYRLQNPVSLSHIRSGLTVKSFRRQ
jgi:hypothetical protein